MNSIFDIAILQTIKADFPSNTWVIVAEGCTLYFHLDNGSNMDKGGWHTFFSDLLTIVYIGLNMLQTSDSYNKNILTGVQILISHQHPHTDLIL